MAAIEEFNDNGFEVLFFKDDNGYHCEILKNDLYVVSIVATTMEELERGMIALLQEVRKQMFES